MSKKLEEDLSKLIASSAKAIGLRETIKAINKGAIATVIVSTNIDASLEKVILTECSQKNISVKRAFTKQELGKIAGLEVSCACIGILR
jgi:large subunit ribosomal protein L7A